MATQKDTKVKIKRENLQELVDNFFEACSLCDELNIYEFEEGDASMQEMKEWVTEKFGRRLEHINEN